jgi:AraC-like DNA-binding protein
MADAFFSALAYLVSEWLDHETPLCLPIASDPLVEAAMDYTSRHLAHLTMTDLCRSVGASERTMRRAFLNDTGMSWRQYLQESRLMKAMAFIAESDRSFLEISLAVGFDSASAFTRAFRRYTGESPSEYRRRARMAPVGTAAMAETPIEEAGKVIREWSHWPGSASALVEST